MTAQPANQAEREATETLCKQVSKFGAINEPNNMMYKMSHPLGFEETLRLQGRHTPCPGC